MSPSEPDAQKEEAALRRISACTLGGITAAHAMIETARDGLFLTHLSAAELPWSYLGIAASTVVASTLTARLRAVLGHRATLVALLWITALGVVAAHRFVLTGDPLAYHALYVWSGVSSGVCVMQFWLGLGERTTLTEGKTRYARIVLGGSLGALIGFAAAAALSQVLAPASLLPLAATCFVLASIGPALFSPVSSVQAPASAVPLSAPSSPETAPALRGLSRVMSEPYALGVTALFSLSTIGFVLADYVFKSSISAFVPPDQLTSWLGTTYLVLNLSATILLAGLVTPILRRIGLQRTLLVSPALLLATALGILFGGVAFATILLAKGTEGVLRHSLDRTSRELLFLPLPDADRPLAKTVAEVIGGKVAKAAGALAILAVMPLGHEAVDLAILLAIVSSAWFATALWLRRPYLDLFRKALSARSIATRLELPDLDLDSLETLIRGLDHPDEDTVGAAIAMLSESDRTHLISSLILYHPSPRIVEGALEVFARAGRADFEPHLDRLLGHDSAAVRAAATRAVATVEPDRERLADLARSECACIRVSAVAGLHSHGWVARRQARLEFEATLDDPSPDARMALARSARLFYTASYRDSLVALLEDETPSVRREAILAMRDSRDEHYVGPLVEGLADRAQRELIREVLPLWGETSVEALESALRGADATLRDRLPIPETLARFGSPAAIHALLRSLDDARSRPGAIRFRILRALSQLAALPENRDAIDRDRLWPILDATLDRALSLVRHASEIESARDRDAETKTHGGDLLLTLLRDKEQLATGRIFLLLGLLHPTEDFAEIQQGLSSGRPSRRSSGIELLDNLLSPNRARAILALSSGGPARARLEAALGARAPTPISLDATLRRLEADESESLRAFGAFFAAEIAMDSECDISRARARADALERIEALSKEASNHAG